MVRKLLILMSIFLCSCLSYSVVPVNVIISKPSEIDLRIYKTVRIVSLTPEANLTAKKLQEQLSTSYNSGLSNIQVIEDETGAQKTDLRIEVSTQQSFDGTRVEEKGVLKSIEKESIAPSSSEKTEYKSIRKTEFTRYHELTMDVDLRIMKNNDNSIIYQKNYQPKATIERKKTGEAPPIIDPEPEFVKTNEVIASSFVSLINPTRTSEIVLVEKVSHNSFDTAISLAQMGQWQKAGQIFSQIQKDMSSENNLVQSKNYYNQALAYQYGAYQTENPKESFQQAINLFQKAYELHTEQLYKNQEEKCYFELQRLKQ